MPALAEAPPANQGAAIPVPLHAPLGAAGEKEGGREDEVARGSENFGSTGPSHAGKFRGKVYTCLLFLARVWCQWTLMDFRGWTGKICPRSPNIALSAQCTYGFIGIL